MSAAPEPLSDLTEDRLLGGRVVLRQPREGYRAGIDPLLLAAALDLRPGSRAGEFGCGAGAALLAAAVLYPGAQLTGVERDPKMAALARANIALNACADRVRAEDGDALTAFAPESLDAVFFNPPFFGDPTALRAPKPGKTDAWLAREPLGDWIAAGLKALKPRGRLTLVHRADALAEALAALHGRAGDLRVLPVAARPGGAARRVLIGARKGGRGPMRLASPLVLHGAEGSGYAADADALLRGEARLALHA